MVLWELHASNGQQAACSLAAPERLSAVPPKDTALHAKASASFVPAALPASRLCERLLTRKGLCIRRRMSMWR